MNDLNAVCVIFFPIVNQTECCGINSTNPIKNPCYWRTNDVGSSEYEEKLENGIYCKFQTNKNKYKLVAGTDSSVSSFFSASKDYVKAFS
jgi:hypothetical protein